MVLWYVANSSAVVPNICVDAKAYRGKVLRWLEPILPGLDNPLLIEETLGDNWTLRLEILQKKVQVSV